MSMKKGPLCIRKDDDKIPSMKTNKSNAPDRFDFSILEFIQNEKTSPFSFPKQ